jgi:hypothetical protein
MIHKCDFFTRKVEINRVMPYCSLGVCHNDLYDIHETEYPLLDRRSPHCPFTDCPHVGEIIEVNEDLGRLIVPRLASKTRKEFWKKCLKLLGKE